MFRFLPARYLACSRPQRIPIALLVSLLITSPESSPAKDSMQSFEKFREFEQIYEPSGVQQLPDGRIVVIEDEATHSVSMISLQPDGRVSEQQLYRGSLFSWSSPNRVLNTLEDLEGVATDRLGRIFAITSHSRTENGKRAVTREQLVRFDLDGAQIVDFQARRGLRKKLFNRYSELKDSTRVRDVKDDGGFNIEGLSFDADKRNLLIGLRSPVAGSEAIIAVLENPAAVFERGEEPRFAERLIELDLAGGGIRALSYDPHLDGFLIISRKPKKAFKLWLWSGAADEPPQRLPIPGRKNLRQAEGVTPIVLNGLPAGILIVSDDGMGVKRKPGHYLFVRYETLVSNGPIPNRPGPG